MNNSTIILTRVKRQFRMRGMEKTIEMNMPWLSKYCCSVKSLKQNVKDSKHHTDNTHCYLDASLLNLIMKFTTFP